MLYLCRSVVQPGGTYPAFPASLAMLEALEIDLGDVAS